MTVYEATTMRDYKLIEEFLTSEPVEATVHVCWMAFGGKTAEWIKKMKEELPELHIYYVLDEKKKMRVVYAEEEHGEIARYNYGFMSQEDYDNQTFTYWKELLPFVWKKNLERGIKVRQTNVPKWIADKVIDWIGADLVKIVETREAPKVGTYYIVEANVEEELLRIS